MSGTIHLLLNKKYTFNFIIMFQSNSVSIGPPITSQPTLQQLLNHIAFPAEDKFMEIGLGLGFELQNLRAIEQQYKKYTHCFLEMFDRWLKSGDDSVTWETIFDVLASESVRRDDLAKSIRRRLSSASKKN